MIQAIIIFSFILFEISLVRSVDQSLSTSSDDDQFYTSSVFESTCPQIIDTIGNGRANVMASDIFYLKTENIYFDISQEINPNQITITIWKKQGKSVQVLQGVQVCTNTIYDEDRETILMSCTATDVHVFKYSNGSFILFQIFQHQNTEQVTDIQLQPHTSQTQFASLCFKESELKFWVSGQILPIRTIYLHVPSSTQIISSAFHFIFIPYTKFICIYDVNKSILRLIDTDMGDVYKTSNKYFRMLFPQMKKYIQYNYLWKFIVVFGVTKQYPLTQKVVTFFANDTSLYTNFQVEYDNEYKNHVTCMHVIQGTEMVALGHNDGYITIHNVITKKMIRRIKISDKQVLDILVKQDTLNVIAKDQNYETIYSSFDWKNNYYVDQRLTNQPQCVNLCDNKQYKASSWLACRTCNPLYKCATCDSNGCTSCNPGNYLDNVTLSSGIVQKTCVLLCSSQLFGLGFDNSPDTKCVEVCPNDIYDVENRVCSLNTQIENSNEFKGLTAKIRLSQENKEEILVDFQKSITFNKNHILSSTQQTVTYIQQCVFVELNNVKSSEYTYTVNLDLTANTYLSITIKLTGKGGIKDPKVFVRFEGQTCFKDDNAVPLGVDLVKTGLSIVLPWNIVNYDPGTKDTSEKLGKAVQGAGDTVAAATFPLFLTNIMYVFWILINVFQLVNFLLYLNVRYPINLVNFFRAFKSFNMNFLPTFGLDFNSKTQEYTFLGNKIVDQIPAMPFQRESMTSSFYLNGLKFLQTFIILYAILYLVRIVARSMKVNCRSVPEDSGFVHKFIALAQQKLEFTMIITTHQSAMLQFSVGIFLQMMGFSSSNAMNVIAFIISILASFYLFLYLKNCYQKVNLNEMIVGSKISDKLVDDKLKDKYEKYKMQYGVLYWNVNFIFYGRRNYHVFMMIKQVFIPFIVVFFNQFTFACIFILIVLYTLNTIFLILYRPFDRKLIGYLSAVNDGCMTIILCLIFYIHTVNENSGSIITEESINKIIQVGWIIISFLLILFLVNIISGIALEWESIKEAFNNLKQKLRDLTKSNSHEFNDQEEKQGLTSQKGTSFTQFNHEGKRNNYLKDSIRSKSRISSDSDSSSAEPERVKNHNQAQNIDLTEISIQQSKRPLNEQTIKSNKKLQKTTQFSELPIQNKQSSPQKNED